jgi:hypothetical protein
MEVFEHQQERLLGREHLHGFSQFAQHPLLRHSPAASLQRVNLGIRQQSWHLQEPARRGVVQCFYDMPSMWAATYLAESLKEGQIRFSYTVLLNTLPAAKPYRFHGDYLGYEGVYQRGFANARFAHDKDDLALALLRLPPPLLQSCQFCLASDHQPGMADRHRPRVCRYRYS